MKNQSKYLLVFFITSMAIIISGRDGIEQEEMDTSSLAGPNPQCKGEKVDFENPADGVCGSLLIRNNIEQLRRLENCTVIEGHLHITLIDRVTPEDYDKYSFPELLEITDHLMLYRVYGIKTLRHLFPNLAVIRGRKLFTNYALVAYEMRDLEELGLINLRVISRGGVRLSKSKKLCYTDTVDWTRIVVDPLALDLKDNKEESQCANYCPDNCPVTKVGDTEAKRCWTSQHCQLGLECQCGVNRTCMADGTCCHEYCLGGCTGPEKDQCISCKDVKLNGTCQPVCPPHTYMFFDRRCLTDKECLSLKNRTEYNDETPKLLKRDKGEPSLCVFKCLENYTHEPEDGISDAQECKKCSGFCPKVCNGSKVTSVADAQKLQHCSKIYGNLLLQIMGGANVALELEKGLGNIREVTGFVSIRRSYALLSLSFFKSLEIVGGEPSTKHQGNSFMVMDNSNLQDLFPEEQMKKMVIKKGKVTFHNNRKLCLYKIYEFVNNLNLTEKPTEQDISSATNGDLTPCREQHLTLNVTVIMAYSALVQFEKNQDTRHLLMYIINYKELKEETTNIDLYYGRDACSDDAWMTYEHYPHDENESEHEVAVLPHLKPYTLYAVYVQAYTLVTAPNSAMSDVVFFTTNPFYPTEPVDVEVSSEHPHELHIQWKPPKNPNGNVTHYKVFYLKQEINIQSFEQRNYCSDPISVQRQKKKDKMEEEDKKINITANCCACPKSKEELEAEARKQEIEVHFENYLHTHVYCKRYDQLPAGVVLPPDINMHGLTSNDFVDDDKNVTVVNTDPKMVPYNTNVMTINETDYVDNKSNDTNTTDIQEVIVYGTEVVLIGLEHFQEYSIEVQACQETVAEEPVQEKLCSNRVLTVGRTKADWTMDRINESTIEVEIVANTSGDVIIRWEQPASPNGLILTFNLFYKRANHENLVPQQICINRQQFQKLSGYKLSGLEPGNWTFQINAVSLAGNSSSTSEKFFIVPQPPGDENSNKVFIAVTVIAIFLLVIIVVVIVWAVAKNKFQNHDLTVISRNQNYISAEQMYIMDGWEVDRDKIKLIKELGQGSFGMVYEGVATGVGENPDEEVRVAVKTVNDRADFRERREFLKEATTMKAFDCFHVVKLLGVVSTGQPALVIMELMALGDLKKYLREHRPEENEPGVSPPTLQDILQMAGEIADGMAYLADKKFVHRDLAARNCMVAEDRTVKIGDFGMTRDIYETDYYRKGGKGFLPVRWMAPESLRDGVFTSMSDVWSYGVVMWEMVTLAAQPYQGLSNEEVVKYISDGNTMEIPQCCPEKMEILMQRCWAKKPKKRPTFKDIIEYLLPDLNPRFEKVSYFFNDGGGPVGGEGDGALGPADNGSDDACSINSLSQEGAAAPRLSSSGKGSGDYQFQTPPHSSRGSASLCEDGLDPHFSHRNLNIDDNFREVDSFYAHSDFQPDIDDSSQPFMSEDLQAVPCVKIQQPALLSFEPNGNDSVGSNSGHIELQPLISKGRGQSPVSPRAHTVQNTSPFSSDYVGHQPPILTSDTTKLLSDPQPSSVNGPVAATSNSDSTENAISPSSSWHRPTTAKPLPASMAYRPTLRLPTLNQPPSGGFRRVPLFSSGDRNNHNTTKNSQPASSDSHQQSKSTSSTPTSNSNVITMEEGLSPTEGGSPPLSARHYSPPPGAITASSSDGSKESSKSSGSHSLINGLTNGHIPLSSVRHRTAPC